MVNFQNFRAVGDKCAVDVQTLLTQLVGECSEEEMLDVFDKLGIGHAPIDVVGTAFSLLRGTAVYRGGARMSEAPGVFDCSSFTKYCYGLAGIWLPRLAIQQFGCGFHGFVDDLFLGDLVFFTGPVNCWTDSPENGVGHVGIYVGQGRVIHATAKTGCVTESPLSRLMKRRRNTRGSRRIIRDTSDTLVLSIPPELEIECSDDVLWLVRRTLAKGRK